jgi:NAD(P)H-quinone oxidoreductase subunit 5
MLASVLVVLAAAPPLALLAVAALPTPVANRHPGRFGKLVVGLSAAALAAFAAAAGLLAVTGPVDRPLLSAPAPLPLNLGVYVDSLTAVMTILISTVGLVIARFAVRGLAGEPDQGRFFKWLAFTVGAVLAMVVARNLLMFTAAWMLTSLGLHKLLLQYPDRPWALWAARKKFLVSRIGDAFLVAALGLTFWCFGSSDYTTVFARAKELAADGDLGWCGTAIGLCFVIGAMTKSAQVPFHSWLPDTMEAPTPISALMHAGIINAGGFLVIRLSPLVSQSHLALDLLAAVGAITALFGGLVMLTQTSIKRALAFSTVAQMGFMMLQCGLGAFSAALLHIVAHSAYKAHAFLASGSVLDAAARLKTAAKPAIRGRLAFALLPVAAVVAGGICLAAFSLAGIDPAKKSGMVVLGPVLWIALATLVWQGLVSGRLRIAAAGIAAAGGVAAAYVAGVTGFDQLLAASSVAREVAPASRIDLAVAGIVVAGFLAVFAIQAAATLMARLPLVRALHVHAANGFYLDIPARQLTARVWGLTTPVP